MKNVSGKAASCRKVPPLTLIPSTRSCPGSGVCMPGIRLPGARLHGAGLLPILVCVWIFLLLPTWAVQGWANVLPHAAVSVGGGGDEPPWYLRSGDPDNPPWRLGAGGETSVARSGPASGDPVAASQVTTYATVSSVEGTSGTTDGAASRTLEERRPAGIPASPAESVLARIAWAIRHWLLIRP